MVTQFAMDLFKDPFFIGWDNHLQKIHQSASYPPYDLVKFDDDSYILDLAVAGFKKENINITVDGNTLIIEGEAPEEADVYEDFSIVHKGIAKRKFKRTFSLGEYMEVDSVNLYDGILRLSISTNIPEYKKPKSIPIN